MHTAIFQHQSFLEHDTGPGHPERPERITAIHRVLEDETFALLERIEAPRGSENQILAAHPESHLRRMHSAMPEEGHAMITADTVVSPKTMEAALRAVGAACAAVDAVASGSLRNAFCVTRPPGHHAESVRAMGFCLFNNAAIAALHAAKRHGMERVAVIDFDVHHGNGTQEIFWDRPDMFYASTHQEHIFPGTGEASEHGASNNIINVPLRSDSGGSEVLDALDNRILPALHAFHPDMIILSAGFDAHRLDPLGGLAWTEDDYDDITHRLMAAADVRCGGRIVSLLEGGYHLDALGHSVARHVRALMEA
jgi:acetoin utilization deacetylase AcuC-like enzyme